MGHMSWGHAVSRDLLRWEHLPLALAEEDGVMIFSGSAVVDWKNTSGFGKDVNMADFRDPKVFWHEATRRWVMVLALSAEKKVHFYTSENLRQWKYVGEFGGAHFKADSDATLWADYGADFYAGVSWSDAPKADGRRVWLGGMRNWQYAQDVPTNPWRSAMTVPRTLALRRTPGGLRLVQQPVAELLKLRQPAPRKFPGVTAKSAFSIGLHTGKDEVTTIACDTAHSRLAVDRTRSGRVDFHKDFPARHEAPLRLADGRVTLRLLVDTSSLEVFAQDGETTLTELIFPTPGPRSLSIQADGEVPRVGAIAIHGL